MQRPRVARGTRGRIARHGVGPEMRYPGDKGSRPSRSEPGAPGSEDAYARGAEAEVESEQPGAPGGREVFPDASDEDPADEPVAEEGMAMPSAAHSESDRALEEQRDKYLRLAAEFDNYRRRTNKERLEAASRGQAELIKALIDPLDDLDRFTGVDAEVTDAATVVQGVELVEKKLRKALGALGLEIIDPVDQPFDPAVHEAVMTEPALSAEDDHLIARVFQKGYVHNGLLIRPARVVVKQWNG